MSVLSADLSRYFYGPRQGTDFEGLTFIAIPAIVIKMEEQNTKINYAQFLLPGAILLAALIISGTLIFTRGQGGSGTAQLGGAPQEQDKPVDIKINSDDHILGNKDAKVTIVEYADFRCPFCERFYTQTEKQLIADYVNTGKVRFIFRNFAFLGQESTWASEAAECAAEQGKY